MRFFVYKGLKEKGSRQFAGAFSLFVYAIQCYLLVTLNLFMSYDKLKNIEREMHNAGLSYVVFRRDNMAEPL